MELSFKDSDRVVKIDGKERGREAEVVYVYNNEQMEIKYCDSPERSYDVKTKHYIFASEWLKKEHLPYRPKDSTIKWVKTIITEDAFELKGEKYIAPISWLSSRLVKLLINKGFLKRIGRLGSLFSNIAEWEKWENSEIKKKAVGRPLHHNCIVYQILEDINQFNG